MLHMRDPQYRVFWFLDAPDTASQVTESLFEQYLADGQLHKVTPSEVAGAVFVCKSLHDKPIELMSLTLSTQPTQATMASQALEAHHIQSESTQTTTAQRRRPDRTRTLVDSQSQVVVDLVQSDAAQDREPKLVAAKEVLKQTTITPSSLLARRSSSPVVDAKHSVAAVEAVTTVTAAAPAASDQPEQQQPAAQAAAVVAVTAEMQPKKRPRDESARSPTRDRAKRPSLATTIAGNAPPVTEAQPATEPVVAATTSAPTETPKYQPSLKTRRLTPPSATWSIKPRDR